LAAPPQVPFVQTSAVVQTLPSLQRLPFGAGGFEQTPVCALQVPTMWH
jgi:hypothetical protein